MSGAVIKPRGRPHATSVRRHSRAKERLMISVDHGVIEQPLPVAAVDESPDLLAGKPDEVSLSDQPFVGLCRGPSYAEIAARASATRGELPVGLGIILRSGEGRPRVTAPNTVAPSRRAGGCSSWAA